MRLNSSYILPSVGRFLILFVLLIPVLSWAQFDLPEVNVVYERPSGPIGFFDGDGDGDTDLLCLASTARGNLLFYENTDGQGTFGDAIYSGDTSWWNYPLLRTSFEPVFSDFDLDGDQDVVSFRRAHLNHPFWINDGSGQFTNPLSAAETESISNFPKVYVGHFNSDDQPDILIYDSGVIGVNYSGPEGYSYQALTDLPPSVFPPSVRVMDVNNDELDDILFFYIGSAGENYAVTVWPSLNDGESFEHAVAQSVVSTHFRTVPDFNVYAIEIADYTGNGFADISWVVQGIWAEDSPEVTGEYLSLFLLENQNGNTVFTEVAREKYVADQVPVDIDNDGYNELVVSEHDRNSYSGSDVIAQHLLRFNGDAFFEKTFIDSVDFYNPRLFAPDLNQDSQPELVSYNGGLLKTRLGQSLIDTPFAETQSISTGTPFFQALGGVYGRHFWDWDADGDQDIILPAQKTEEGEDFVLQVYFQNNEDGLGTYGPPILLWESSIVPGSPLINMADLNTDGWPDFFILAYQNNGGEGAAVRPGVIALSNTTDSTYTPYFLEDTNFSSFAELQYDDLDNDGDQDGLVLQANGNIAAVWNEISEQNRFTVTNDFIQGPVPEAAGFRNFCLEDFDQDGEPDLLLTIQNPPSLYWALQLDGAGTFESWQNIPGNPLVTGNIPFSPYRGDFDGDGDIDLHLYSLAGTSFLAYFDSESATFRRLLPYYFDAGRHLGPSNPVIDANQDGAMDVYTNRGIMLSTPGSGYPRLPYLPTPDGEMPDDLFSSLPALGNVDGDDHLEVVSNENYNLYWYNLDFIPNRTVQGFVRFDTTTSCTYSESLPPLSNWLVQLDNDSLPQLTLTNGVGYYGALLNDALDYTLRAIPPSAYWEVCTPDTLLTSPSPAGVDTVHFLAQAVTDCAILRVDLTSTPIRQCFNSTVSIHYQNVGTALLPDAQITLTFNERFSPISSTLPWAMQTDTSLVFELADVPIGGFGDIGVILSPDCAGLELGETVCFTTQVSPDSLCQDPLLDWSGASLEAYSYCESDSLAFVITNTGTGGMTEPEPLELSTIINDDFVIFLMGETQLGPGASDTIRAPLYPEVLRLRIDQPTGHPYPEDIDLLAAGCAENSDTITPLLISLPNTEGDPFVNTYCTEVVGPYDPNLKAAVPRGLSEEMHWVERDWRITYTIHFQNTGTDLARNVYLRDTLSHLLDWTSFRLGATSHPLELQFLPNGQILFTFSNINLPDSTSNEVGSHGFASFSIQPHADTTFGSCISNRAGIYFDFNPPIVTEEVFHTIRKPSVATVLEVGVCTGNVYLSTPILHDTILQEAFSLPDQDSIVWHYVFTLPKSFVDTTVMLEVPTFYNSTYVTGDTAFTALLTNQFGCDSLVLVTVDAVTDTEEPLAVANIQVHPNPTQDVVTVSWSAVHINISTVEVYGVNGKRLMELAPPEQGSQLNIDLSPLPPGNYLLRINGQKTITITITKT